jgi:hypothetical protein
MNVEKVWDARYTLGARYLSKKYGNSPDDEQMCAGLSYVCVVASIPFKLVCWYIPLGFVLVDLSVSC